MKAAKGKQRELAWHGKPTPGLLEALAVTAVHRDPGLLSKWDRIACNFQSILSILALNYIFIKLSASCVCVCVCAQSHPACCDSQDYSTQVPLCMEFSRQEYWSGLPFPSSGNLPDPGIKPASPTL